MCSEGNLEGLIGREGTVNAQFQETRQRKKELTNGSFVWLCSVLQCIAV